MPKTTANLSTKQPAKKMAEMARLNCIIPVELHRRVKASCAIEGLNMTEVVIEFLESRFPAPHSTK